MGEDAGVSGCRIERELGDVAGTLGRAKAECEKFRSVWIGDTEGGRYELRTPLGMVVGTYSVAGQRVTFLVEKKPRVVPCALVERVLDLFLDAGG